MSRINSKAYALFRAGNDSVSIAEKLKITESEAANAIARAREESRRGDTKSSVPTVDEPSVESN